jgi:hypothetical protein
MKSMCSSGKPAYTRALKLKGFSGDWQTGLDALLAGLVLAGIILGLMV